MKRTLLCMLLAVVLVFASFPVVLAETKETLVPNYDNSFVVTVETDSSRNFGLADFPELPDADHLMAFERINNQQGYTYQLLVVDGSQPVETAMNLVKENPLVAGVSRNIYANDYREKASSLTLSATSLEIPVGGSTTVKIVGSDLKQGCYDVVGINITVDPEVVSYQQLQNLVFDMGDDCALVTLYQDDLEFATNQNGRLLYEHYDGRLSFADGSDLQRVDAQSPIHQYIIGSSRWLNSYESVVEDLIQMDGMESVQLVYQILPTGMPPHEEWTVEDPEIATITTEGDDPYGLFATVTVTGKQAGKTVLMVQHGGGSVSVTAQCAVTVYEPQPDTPTDIPQNPDTPTNVTPTSIHFGNVNFDEAIDAKDALEVLKYAVKKVAFNEQQKQAAEVTGDGEINAKDALQILRYAVGLIDKFPVEELLPETSTNVTQTDTPLGA